MHKINIAIDGYSSCGKSTLAKQLAKDLGYVYVDSGAMYRAITLYAMQQGLFDSGELNVVELIAQSPSVDVKLVYNQNTGKQNTILNGKDVEGLIRGLDVANKVSEVATIKEVRAHMVHLQQQMAAEKGIVMDGRDIGTVVLPQAELKIFMTASPDIRAQRRLSELEAKGDMVSLEEVKQNLTQRDFVDENRTESPLKQADDAIVLDNSTHTLESQLALVKSWVAEKECGN